MRGGRGRVKERHGCDNSSSVTYIPRFDLGALLPPRRFLGGCGHLQARDACGCELGDGATSEARGERQSGAAEWPTGERVDR